MTKIRFYQTRYNLTRREAEHLHALELALAARRSPRVTPAYQRVIDSLLDLHDAVAGSAPRNPPPIPVRTRAEADARIPCPFCVGRLGRVVTTCEDCLGTGTVLAFTIGGGTPTTPYFTHDCETCVYLGSARIDDEAVDFYRHPGRPSPTALARTGNDGPDYCSMPESMLATVQHVGVPLAEYRQRYLLPSA